MVEAKTLFSTVMFMAFAAAARVIVRQFVLELLCHQHPETVTPHAPLVLLMLTTSEFWPEGMFLNSRFVKLMPVFPSTATPLAPLTEPGKALSVRLLMVTLLAVMVKGERDTVPLEVVIMVLPIPAPLMVRALFIVMAAEIEKVPAVKLIASLAAALLMMVCRELAAAALEQLVPLPEPAPVGDTYQVAA